MPKDDFLARLAGELLATKFPVTLAGQQGMRD